ncbi:lysozyme g-like [Eleutherodactylus coqui]|uniref:lysozyme g-like n=1 Tax=Eleutherodactylus coqui TaxID=57060 RepID=UPI0034631BB3
MNFYIVIVLSVFAGFVATSGKYGDITKVPTTGASLQTAKQDKLTYGGVKASQKLAATDLGRMSRYKAKILAVAKKENIDPAIITGMISRETRAGNTLVNGWGDHNNAWGLMQVDKRYHKPVGAWDSEQHITQGTQILIYMWNAIKKKFPKASNEAVLKGSIAAYNAGQNSVTDLNKVDQRTTGGDYANDVVARAQYFKSHGY